jgi:glutamine cyclotransferase
MQAVKFNNSGGELFLELIGKGKGKLVAPYLLTIISCVLSFLLYAAEDLPLYTYEIIEEYPHDPAAFTQGLTWHDGFLYEGTGRNGQSTLRKVALESGELLQRHNLGRRYFGEGIAIRDGLVYQLTWQSHIGFIYDLETFEQQETFFVAGEGWGITFDDEHLIISDGSATLRFLDPTTQSEVRRLTVMLNDQPVSYLNELEFIKGEIWANVWYQDVILRIDPQSGKVNSLVDLTGLYPERRNADEVLNGIAWDNEQQRLFVTGKLWPVLYEIALQE